MHYVIYMSTAVKPFTDDELKELLIQSRRNNLRDNITGMLLYSRGSFVQVLEGDKEPLEALYVKILADKRHRSIFQLAYKPLEKRNFPHWSMGFKVIESGEYKELDGYFNPIPVGLFKKASHASLSILKTFAQSNF